MVVVVVILSGSSVVCGDEESPSCVIIVVEEEIISSGSSVDFIVVGFDEISVDILRSSSSSVSKSTGSWLSSLGSSCMAASVVVVLGWVDVDVDVGRISVMMRDPKVGGGVGLTFSSFFLGVVSGGEVVVVVVVEVVVI